MSARRSVDGGQTSANAALSRLKKHLADGNRLSPKYGTLADYILRHPNDAAFSTALELAEAANVSEATVIRFANALSYESYTDFRRDFQRWINDELTTVHRMRDSISTSDGDHALAHVVQSEIRNLEQTLSSVSTDDIELAAGLMLQAESLFVVGLRASAGLARYLAYEASEIVPRAKAFTTGGADVLAEVAAASDAVVVAFGFPRYPRETIEILDASRHNKLSTIAITDSFSSPLVERSDVTLFAQTTSIGPVDALAGPLAVATALAVQATRSDEDRALEGLARFERVADAVGLYWPGSPS